jgi:hypothetical protein
LDKHHCAFAIQESALEVFDPILKELSLRVSGEGQGSLFGHEISGAGVHTKAVKFECTTYVNEAMQDQLQNLLLSAPLSDGIPRRCFRALANHYETSVTLSSKQALSTPLLKPHRDDVNNADLSIVIGITERSSYRGALLYISTGLSSILNATVPLFGAVVAWVWLRDKPSLSRTVGLVIGFGGVVLLAGGQASFKPNASGIAPAWAVLACLAATTCYALSASFTNWVSSS